LVFYRYPPLVDGQRHALIALPLSNKGAILNQGLGRWTRMGVWERTEAELAKRPTYCQARG